MENDAGREAAVREELYCLRTLVGRAVSPAPFWKFAGQS